MTITNYDRAAASRQQVLDYLNSVENMQSGTEIRCATGLHKNVWQACLKTMRGHGEIKSVGNGKASRYRALVKTTISADALREVSDQARKETREGKPPRTTRGGYVHKAGHYDVPGHVQGQPLRNQEAQGSGRMRVYVGGAE